MPRSEHVTHGEWHNQYVIKYRGGKVRRWLAKKLKFGSPQAKLAKQLGELSYNSSAVTHRVGNRVSVHSGLDATGNIVTDVLFQFTLSRRMLLADGLGGWLITEGNDGHEKREIARLMQQFGQRDERVRRKLLELAKGHVVLSLANRLHYDAAAAKA